MATLTTNREVIVFCSSSGHCQLDCTYCIVNPVIKRNPSITYEDLAFFMETVRRSVFFIFSGKGDFFAGYARRDRFLDRLLDHDVEVALDINGILLQDYPELAREKLDRIRHINLTMHFEQLRLKHVEKVWVENAKAILERHRGEMVMNTIFSPLTRSTWEESLAFYEREIFDKTGQKTWVVEDCDRPYTAEERQACDELKERYAFMIDRVYHQDFAAAFAGKEAVLCPAGQSYFRIWNDGRVEGCPYIPELSGAGNLKDRQLRIRSEPFRCTTPKYCDCYDIHQLGRMGFEEPAGTPLPAFASR